MKIIFISLTITINVIIFMSNTTFSVAMARTPLKEINFLMCNSPTIKNNTFADQQIGTIEISNGTLRTLTSDALFTGSFTEMLNTKLPNFQLKQSERLEIRISKECHKAAAEYRKLNGGHKKTKFNQKIRQISILKDELDEVKTSNTNTPLLSNNGLRLDNVSNSHKKNVRQKLENNVVKALEFVETFGVLPKKLVCESFGGGRYVIDMDGNDENVPYENMSPREKVRVRQILNICDNAMVSDEAYHELAQHVPEMPRKYNLVACRNELDSKIEINRTPGLLPGSFVSLESELSKFIQGCCESNTPLPDKLKIKISGDGAKASRISNFIVFSFSMVFDENFSQSHLNQNVLAIVNCDENYTNLEKSLGPVLEEINLLHDKGTISYQGRHFQLEFFVGGDMKFIQLMYGINSSIANYACPWCKVSKEDRGVITFPQDHYNAKNIFRSIEEIRSLASSASKNKYGVKTKPLLNIELDHVVPDELHLLMRVMDVLLRNIIDDAKSKDEYAKITGQSTDNLSLLVKAIQGCGVTFKTWVSKSGELDWTSLCGSDVKKVLRLLPDKLVFCLHEDTRESVISLWKNFLAIYEEITLKSCMTFDETAIFTKVHGFMSLFLDIGKRKREGYLPKNVTPYLHTLLYHVPFFVSQYGSLAKFSGQGVEKTNDAIKHIHQTKSNKHDPTSDALRVRKRIELGHRSELTREKRKYEKQDNDYWGNRIIHIRESKKRRVEEEIYEANTLYQETHAKSHPNFEDMSDQEIKQKLIDLGEKTKLRKREKLIEKLTAVMKAKQLISLQ